MVPIRSFASASGLLYFSPAARRVGSCGAATDTTAGTIQIKDINPGSASSDVGRLKVIGNTIYFQANNGVNGSELWRSNGSSAGTVLVKDLVPGPIGSDPLINYGRGWLRLTADSSLQRSPMSLATRVDFGRATEARWHHRAQFGWK